MSRKFVTLLVLAAILLITVFATAPAFTQGFVYFCGGDATPLKKSEIPKDGPACKKEKEEKIIEL